MTSVEIRRVETNKKQYLALLLLADEQEDMIDRYLERGSMYVLEDDGVKAECVVTDEGGGVLELKNIAVEPDFQGKGYGKALFKKLAATAVERGCGRLEWSCLDWNRPSIDFYLSLGAEPMEDWTTYRFSGNSLKKMAETDS